MTAFIVIVLVVLLLYGGERLGVLGKGLGEGVKAFRRTIRENDSKESPPEVISITSVEPSPPKLLPAKGESSPESPGSDPERH